MVDWRTLEAKADRIIGAAFDEEVRHLPQKNGTADTGRPIQNIRGVLHTPSPEGTISIGAGIVTNMAAAEAALVVQRAEYPSIVFRQKDKIRGNELPGAPIWEVKNINDRFSSIIVLTLNQSN